MSILNAVVVIVSLMAPRPDAGSFHCVVTGELISKPVAVLDYAGVRYGTCCPACATKFLSSPAKFVDAAAKRGLLDGTSFFDPVSGERIDPKPNTNFAIYEGVKYYFSKPEEKATFLSSPKNFTKVPVLELMHCPVEDEDITSYSAAGGFVDVQGTRYYVCCTGCLLAMKKAPTKHIGPFKSQAKPARATQVTKKSSALKG